MKSCQALAVAPTTYAAMPDVAACLFGGYGDDGHGSNAALRTMTSTTAEEIRVIRNWDLDVPQDQCVLDIADDRFESSLAPCFAELG